MAGGYTGEGGRADGRTGVDWGEVAGWLKARETGASLGLKARWLGSLIDATTLRRRGWKRVESGPRGVVTTWEGCVWWEKRVGETIVQLGTSYFLKEEGGGRYATVPRSVARHMAREERTARVATEALRFLRAVDGRREWLEAYPDTVEERVLDAVSADLSECELKAPGNFLEDLRRRTDPLEDCSPETTEDRLVALDNLLREADAEGVSRPAEGWLVRWARAVAAPEADPEGAAALEEVSDGRLVWNLIYRWGRCSKERGAMARIVAWALEREPGWSERFTAIAWSGLGETLWDLGLRRCGMAAMERALGEEDAAESNENLLWTHLQNYWADLDADEDGPEEAGWYVQAMHRNEERFAEREGYWTLLGLALALNGNDPELAGRTIGDGDGERGRQARRCAAAGDWRWVRRALRAYPESAAEVAWDTWDLPEHPWPSIVNEPLLETVWKLSERGTGADWWAMSWRALDGGRWREIPSPLSPGLPKGGYGRAARAWLGEGPGECEIALLRVQITENPRHADSPAEEPVRDTWRNLPVPCPRPAEPNARAAAWAAAPHWDGALGDFDFRLGDGRGGGEGDRTLWHGLCSYFALERSEVARGVPTPAFVSGFGAKLRIGDRREHAGLKFIHPAMLDDEARSLYAFRGEVAAVRRVGAAGYGKVLRMDLDVGEAMPFALPVYAREELVENRNERRGRGRGRGGCAGVRVGDMLEGYLFLHVDFWPEDDVSRAWRAEHPTGSPFWGGEESEEEMPVAGYPKENARGVAWFFSFLGRVPNGFTVLETPGPGPERLDAKELARRLMRQRSDDGECEVDLVAVVGGRVRQYRVRKVVGKRKVRWDLPDDIEGLVVRAINFGEAWLLEYEGFPEPK